jgi:hypothetical protein
VEIFMVAFGLRGIESQEKLDSLLSLFGQEQKKKRVGENVERILYLYFFLIGVVGGGVQLGPLGSAATNRPTVPAPGDYDDGEIGGLIGRGNRSTRRKPAPVPLYPPQTPRAARTRNRTAVGSQRLLNTLTNTELLLRSQKKKAAKPNFAE